jgi:hypothetical protein
VVGFGADGPDPQQVILIRVFVSQQASVPVVGGDQQIEVSVIIEITVSGASANGRPP